MLGGRERRLFFGTDHIDVDAESVGVEVSVVPTPTARIAITEESALASLADARQVKPDRHLSMSAANETNRLCVVIHHCG